MESIQKSVVSCDIVLTIKEKDSSGALAVVDCSGVTTKQIIFKKPDNTLITKTAAFVTNGTDGKIKYRTIAGDIDQVGTWSCQGYVVFPVGFDGRSSVVSFYVADNLS